MKTCFTYDCMFYLWLHVLPMNAYFTQEAACMYSRVNPILRQLYQGKQLLHFLRMTSPESIRTAASLQHDKAYIDGKWVSAKSGNTFTGSKICLCHNFQSDYFRGNVCFQVTCHMQNKNDGDNL